MKIIVSKKNEKYGPFELSQVQYYVDAGFFQLTDFCYVEGWEKWELLSTIVSRIPVIENDIKTQPSINQTPPEPSNSDPNEKKCEKEAFALNDAHSSDKTLGHFQDDRQNSQCEVNTDPQGCDVHKLSNMASFGFFNYKHKNQINTLVYIARNGTIMDHCPKHMIAAKLCSGQLQPDDWFYEDSTKEWKHLRQSSW